QMDICMQCHLETTSVELPQMLRRFERSMFSFRPGERLGDYIVHFDSASGQDRFEIVNQAYRLRRSKCFRESAGRLTCTTCHNPHRVERGAAAVAWQRSRCLGCHAALDRTSHPDPQSADCASCHMVRRRTEDAIHVIVTDHLIIRRPPPNPISPRDELTREFKGPLSVYYPELPDRERDLYLGAALIIGGRDRRSGIDLLKRSLDPHSPAKAVATLAE